jgi:hypothetical protein
MSLFRLLISDRVFKIGNAIKADLTQVKKQFPQLHRQQSFNIIDLKEYGVHRGVVWRNASGLLGILLEKTLGIYISKDEQYRKSEEWERTPLDASLLSYAALDVYACFLIFGKMILVSPIACIQFTMAPGTPVVLLTHEGGLPSAYGTIVDLQPSTYGSIKIKTPIKSCLLIEIHEILVPAATVILHHLPGHSASHTKCGALTLDQLQEVAGNEPLRVVVPISHLEFDKKRVVMVCKLFFGIPPCYNIVSSCQILCRVLQQLVGILQRQASSICPPLIWLIHPMRLVLSPLMRTWTLMVLFWKMRLKLI